MILRGHAQASALLRIERSIGVTPADKSVVYDYMVDTEGARLSATNLPGPVWLRSWIGIDCLSDVVEVDFDPAGDIRSSPLLLRGLHSLRRLRFPMHDQNLKELRGFDRLEELEVRRAEELDDGLAALASLPRLRILKLHCHSISDSAILALSDFPALEVVALNRQTIDAGRLLRLMRTPQLKKLILREVQITGNLPNVFGEDLPLENFMYLGSEGPIGRLLFGLPNLVRLDLSDSEVADEHLRAIRNMEKLESIRMERTGITDAGLTLLQEHPSLIEVELAETRTSTKARRELALSLKKFFEARDENEVLLERVEMPK